MASSALQRPRPRCAAPPSARRWLAHGSGAHAGSARLPAGIRASSAAASTWLSPRCWPVGAQRLQRGALLVRRAACMPACWLTDRQTDSLPRSSRLLAAASAGRHPAGASERHSHALLSSSRRIRRAPQPSSPAPAPHYLAKASIDQEFPDSASLAFLLSAGDLWSNGSTPDLLSTLPAP
jgi:hypothetical protein